MNREENETFAQESQKPQPGFFTEFVQFALHNKKWWLIPLLVVILALSGLVIVGGSGAAPFIYSLF